MVFRAHRMGAGLGGDDSLAVKAIGRPTFDEDDRLQILRGLYAADLTSAGIFLTSD